MKEQRSTPLFFVLFCFVFQKLLEGCRAWNPLRRRRKGGAGEREADQEGGGVINSWGGRQDLALT